MKKKLILSLLFATCLLSVSYAQRKVAVSGFVKDSESADALMRATVQIMDKDTAKMVLGTVTNNIGGYTVKNVNPGTYVVKISYIGYHNFFRKIEIPEGKTTFNVGTTMLVPSSVMLQTAVVTAALQQVEVKEDTILFNADAFKTPEGSVLEELIKKIPGATVDSDGKITINGKTVTKILVKGKEFFNNDTQMAMKNLPVEIINKVKVYDKKSDLTRITGIDDGQEETVIDLDVKKGMDRGWFGNIDLGLGTHDRWSGRFNIQRFADGQQASILSNMNSDGTRRNGQVGANLAYDFGDNLEVGGNIRYNGSRNKSWNKSNSQNFTYLDFPTFSNNYSNSKSHNNSVSGDFKIEWKLDSLTTILFRPNFSFGNNDSWNTGNNASFQKNDPYEYTFGDAHTIIDNPLDMTQFDALPDSIKTNLSRSGGDSDGNSKSVRGNLLLNHRMMKRGRNMSVRLDANWSDDDNTNFNLNDVRYFQEDPRTHTKSPDQFLYRYRTSPNDSKGITAGFTYSEPLLEGLTLQLNYQFSHSRRTSDSRTYNMSYNDIEQNSADPYRNNRMFNQLRWQVQGLDSLRQFLLDNVGMLPLNFDEMRDSLESVRLSNYSDDINNSHNMELSLRYNTEFINATLGVQYQPQHQKIDYAKMGHDTIASRNYARLTPTVNFRYRFTRQHSIRIQYRGNVSQPSFTNLIDWTDDSNPMRISHGNPDLKPSFSHNVSLQYQNYVTARMQSYNANVSFQTTSDNISNRTQYIPETGKQETWPENINGNWNINGSVGFSTPLFVERLMLNTNTNVGYRNNVSFLYQNFETYKNTVKNTSVGERLSFTYRETYWDVSLSGNLNYSNSKSMLMPANNQNTFNFNYGLSSTGQFDNGFGFSTDINMSSRRGYTRSDANTDELIWNAQISYRFLQGRKASIRLMANDILQQRSNISRNISATNISESENQTIYSYLMVHFMYRFNIFGTREGRRELREQRAMRGMSDEAIRNMPIGGGFGGRGGGGGGGGFGGGRGR